MTDKYNDGYTHEALHSAHIVNCMLDDFVTESRCASEFPDVKVACDTASEALYNLYQLIGRKFKDE